MGKWASRMVVVHGIAERSLELHACINMMIDEHIS